MNIQQAITMIFNLLQNFGKGVKTPQCKHQPKINLKTIKQSKTKIYMKPAVLTPASNQVATVWLKK